MAAGGSRVWEGLQAVRHHTGQQGCGGGGGGGCGGGGGGVCDNGDCGDSFGGGDVDILLTQSATRGKRRGSRLSPAQKENLLNSVMEL